MTEQMNFDEFFEDSNKQSEIVDGHIQVDDYRIQEFCKRLSGKDLDGKNLSKLSYTNYVVKNEDFEHIAPHSVININDVEVNIYPNRTLPDFYTVDLVFPNANVNDLKLLWLRLEKFKKDNLTADFDSDAIFLLQVIENYDEKDLESAKNRLYCNIINPLLFYITRSTPNQLVAEMETSEGLQGGNIIRLLCHSALVTFDVLDDLDVDAVKEEIAYERETLENAERMVEREITTLKNDFTENNSQSDYLG